MTYLSICAPLPEVTASSLRSRGSLPFIPPPFDSVNHWSSVYRTKDKDLERKLFRPVDGQKVTHALVFVVQNTGNLCEIRIQLRNISIISKDEMHELNIFIGRINVLYFFEWIEILKILVALENK